MDKKIFYICNFYIPSASNVDQYNVLIIAITTFFDSINIYPIENFILGEDSNLPEIEIHWNIDGFGV